MLTTQLLDLVSRHKVASPNTAVAFRDEMVKYGIIQPVPGSEGRRQTPYEPAQVTLAALFQWHILHLGTLDGLDGGGRSAALRADPQALRRLQPMIADGLLELNTVRQPDPTFALLAWVDEGGIVMDRLMVGCEQGAGGLDRVLTDLTSVTGLAERLKLSRTQLGRKLAAAEAMGSLGWEGARGAVPHLGQPRLSPRISHGAGQQARGHRCRLRSLLHAASVSRASEPGSEPGRAPIKSGENPFPNSYSA